MGLCHSCQFFNLEQAGRHTIGINQNYVFVRKEIHQCFDYKCTCPSEMNFVEAATCIWDMADFSNTVLLDSIQSVWHEWNSQDRSIFQLKWIETIVNSGVLLLGPRRQLLIECSGLGGAPIFDSIQGDLFLKCMSTTPVYGPSLAHLDIYDDNQKYRHTTSIGG